MKRSPWVCVAVFGLSAAVVLAAPYQPDKIVPLPVPPNPGYTNYDSGSVSIGLYPASYSMVLENTYRTDHWKEWYVQYTITPIGPNPTGDLHVDYSDKTSDTPPTWNDFRFWQTYYGPPPSSGTWTVVGYPSTIAPIKVNPQQAELVINTDYPFNPAWVSLHFAGNNVRIDYTFYDWCIPEPASLTLLALGGLDGLAAKSTVKTRIAKAGRSRFRCSSQVEAFHGGASAGCTVDPCSAAKEAIAMRKILGACTALSAVIVVVAFSSPARASNVGNGPGTPGDGTYEMNTSGGWELGSPGAPIGITLDPNAGPWVKTLTGPNGADFGADDTGYIYPVSYGSIVENLVITGNPSWTDWHEDILTPGWVWGATFFDIPNNPPPGLEVMHYDQAWPNHGGGVQFNFDALASGTQIKITKALWWVGDPNVVGNLFWGKVVISEYPTPEPTTLLLLGLGALAYIGRRWR